LDAVAAQDTASPVPPPDIANLETLTGPFNPDGDTDTCPPGELPDIPGYRVVRIIGSGGMGTVYKAVHIAFNRVEAIKIINAGLAAESGMRARFAREVKILAQLDHPNIVPVYHAGTWRGSPFLTMKFIPGRTLYHHLERLRSDLPAACRLMVKVARAVEYLHAKGIIHRDLKPLNILLTTDDTPLVADFGLVRLIEPDAEMTLSVAPVGTRQFMSPEQTYGGRESHFPACDIWALGVILYELLTGTRPFGHDDQVELYRRIRHDPTPRMQPELAVPPALEAITRKCLEKSPADRYASAEEIARDLERWLAGELVLPATPEPVQKPSAKPTRRNNRLVALGVMAVIALIVIPASVVRWEKPAPEPVEITPVVPKTGPHPDKRTIADELNAGETIVFIEKTGMPLRSTTSLPGCDSFLKIGPEGLCVLSSVGTGAVELSNDPLPLPMLFEAEFAILTRPGAGAIAGIYAMRNETRAGEKTHQTMLLFAERTVVDPRPNGPPVWNQSRSTLMSWWRNGPLGDLHTFGDQRSLIAPPGQGQQLRWNRVVLRLERDRVSCTWSGDLFPTITTTEMREELDTLKVGTPFAQVRFAPAVAGSGFGLMTYRGEAVYRNVKLIPVTP
jgi:serine/threonine-protein kinase